MYLRYHKGMRHNQLGFSLLRIFIFIVVLGLLFFAAWKIYDSQKDNTSNPTNGSGKASTELQVPKDWPKYENAQYSISFNYPKGWDSSKFTVTQYNKDQAIPSAYSAQSSVVFVSNTNNWARFLNYGDPTLQEPVSPSEDSAFDLNIVRRPDFAQPFAYLRQGNANIAQYYMYLSDSSKAYVVSFPAADSTELGTTAWNNLLKEQGEALPKIIQSISMPKVIN